jgi:hypothetical protein
MTIVCNILIGLAVLITILLFVLKADAGRMAGPDKGGEIVLFIIMGARWLLVAVVLAWCALAGRFDWIGGSTGTRVLVVLATHLGIGFISGLAMAAALSQVAGVRLGGASAIGWAGLPILVMLIALAAADGRVLGREGGVRWLQAALGAIGAAGWLLAGALWVTTSIQTSRQRAESRAAMQAESDAQQSAWEAKQREEEAALEVMDRSLPLDQWIVMTHPQYSERHQERAAELIAQRPRLVEELTEMLGRDDPMQREYANDFIRRLKPPPRDLTPALARAQRMLAELLIEAVEGRTEQPRHALGMSSSTLLTAEGMGDPAELREGLRALLEVIRRLPDSQSQRDLIARYEAFLAAEVGQGRAK